MPRKKKSPTPKQRAAALREAIIALAYEDPVSVEQVYKQGYRGRELLAAAERMGKACDRRKTVGPINPRRLSYETHEDWKALTGQPFPKDVELGGYHGRNQSENPVLHAVHATVRQCEGAYPRSDIGRMTEQDAIEHWLWNQTVTVSHSTQAAAPKNASGEPAMRKHWRSIKAKVAEHLSQVLSPDDPILGALTYRDPLIDTGDER